MSPHTLPPSEHSTLPTVNRSNHCCVPIWESSAPKLPEGYLTWAVLNLDSCKHLYHYLFSPLRYCCVSLSSDVITNLVCARVQGCHEISLQRDVPMVSSIYHLQDHLWSSANVVWWCHLLMSFVDYNVVSWLWCHELSSVMSYLLLLFLHWYKTTSNCIKSSLLDLFQLSKWPSWERWWCHSNSPLMT